MGEEIMNAKIRSQNLKECFRVHKTDDSQRRKMGSRNRQWSLLSSLFFRSYLWQRPRQWNVVLERMHMNHLLASRSFHLWTIGLPCILITSWIVFLKTDWKEERLSFTCTDVEAVNVFPNVLHTLKIVNLLTLHDEETNHLSNWENYVKVRKSSSLVL